MCMSGHFCAVLEYELTASNNDNRAKVHNRSSAHRPSFCHRPLNQTMHPELPQYLPPQGERPPTRRIPAHDRKHRTSGGRSGRISRPLHRSNPPAVYQRSARPISVEKEERGDTPRAQPGLSAHTGSVVDMLTQFLEPFGVFCKTLVTDKVGIEVKRKVLWVFLGALNPYTRKVRSYSS